ncbi:MAG: PilC/PilY family type IV pilus protein [Pseudomonadota bacterium]
MNSYISLSKRLPRVTALVLSLAFALPAQAQVAQVPLFLGAGDVPGNLLLVPSVEWPTINSVSSQGNYTPAQEFYGYFDSDKCYDYVHSTNRDEQHFIPVGAAVGHVCAGHWSGNFLNWAATQTIDPFRKVLTGGLRVRDTASETWLEKARHSGQGGSGIYPNRRIPASGTDSALVSGATPFSAGFIRMRIAGLGNRMRFRLDNDNTSSSVTDYVPGSPFIPSVTNELAVRVAVCVNGLLEDNCIEYDGGRFKPEGLVQQYSEDIRYGIFGYLLDSNIYRDGAVLRARQDFVGQTAFIENGGLVPNPNPEWDPDTGVQYVNPRPDDASATSARFGISITNSGFINYINKFGQLNGGNHKSFDPVSELYYSGLRYLKNQGNVPQYSAMPGNTGVNPNTGADGFPVIENWNDPIEFACQKNVMLGIGDIYTHRDKNLPGTSNRNQEPAVPPAVAADNTLNVSQDLARIASLEGIGIATPFSGLQNSAYIAAMAWHANTEDLRPDIPGDQYASTYWVDVLEAQSLAATPFNQYYMAAKYGGFEKPEDFDPDTVATIPVDWYSTTGDTLTTFGSRRRFDQTFDRPDNYYLEGNASQLAESLTQAFADIAEELRSSASAVAANSTRLGADTLVFQGSFDSSRWSGDIKAFKINLDGSIEPNPLWSAAEKLDLLTDSQARSRTVLTIQSPSSGDEGSEVSTTGRWFRWNNLDSAQRNFLRTNPTGGPRVSAGIARQRRDYLMGERDDEFQNGGPYRERDSRLGDIINSDPQFIHKQDFGYAVLDQSTAFAGEGAGEDYTTFRRSAAYQNRSPMVVVSANDGMMHGFEASASSSGGEELFAYVPNAAIEDIYKLTLPTYSHQYYVDGSPRISDAWFNSAWHTVVVGTTGAGGKSVFALDITNPDSMNRDDVLWEFSHPDMGYTIGQPAIVPLPNGRFGAVVTSGYDTGKPDGKIWIIDIADGGVFKTLTTPNSGELGQPLVTDLNGDRVADRVYVGDTEGNVWRFDLEGTNVNDWRPPTALRSGSTPLPLFVARDRNGQRQSITAPLASATGDDGFPMVFFGTGAFYAVNDNVVPPNPDIETFYGIVDNAQKISGRAELLQQQILAEVSAGDLRVRAVTDNERTPSERGWYMDLVWDGGFGGPGGQGERVTTRALVRGDRVIFVTLIPAEDPCAFGGDSWLMELNTFDGGRLDYAVFDLDRNAQFDDSDWVDITLPDGSTQRVPPSGLAPDINTIKTPAIITGVGANNDEVKLVSGSSGRMIGISERGASDAGRMSWRQMR